MEEKVSNAAEELSGVSTVGKAIEVLDLIYEFGRPVRLKELQLASRFPKPTLYRFVQTLTEHGMLSYDPDRNAYFLGIHLVRLAHAAWRQSMIVPVAQPHLRELACRIGETVYLSKLDGGQCVTLDSSSPDELAGLFWDSNRVYPSYCTAVGKAMLACLPDGELDRALLQQSYHKLTEASIGDQASLRAELDETRKRGYAIEKEEHVRGIVAVAVPILAPSGTLLGGLGIHAMDRRTDLDTLKSRLPDMQEAAGKIARDAAAWRLPETSRPLKQHGG